MATKTKRAPRAKSKVKNVLASPEPTEIQNGLSDALLGFSPMAMGDQLSQVDTMFKSNRWYLVSNMRQLLSEMYIEQGLVQTVVDVPVDDAMRGGIEIKSKQLDADQILELQSEIEREDDLTTVGQGLKWNRLFGGGGILILTDQPSHTPLDLNAIKEDTPLEFVDVDMWELFFSLQDTSDTNAVITKDQIEGVEFYNYYGQRIHRSRVIKMKGLKAPSFVRPRLRSWGLSVMEPLVRSINQYLKATGLTFEVMDEFKLDIFKIKGLTSTLLSKGGDQKIRDRVQLANQQKNFQNALTMDAEDDYVQKQLSFAGISEAMVGVRMQVASDLRMPLTKIFGISAAGFSSGEDDIENYNSMVESKIRQKAKFDILRMIEIRCQKMFGFIPDDLSITFKPLRVLSSEQEENVKTQKFARLLQAKQAGEITSQEFRQACNKDGLLPLQFEDKGGLLGEAPDKGEAPTDDEGGESGETGKAPETKLRSPEAETAKNAGDARLSEIVTVGLVAGKQILTGRRRDNNLWTNPGGHMDEDESPEQAACREVYEEAGIQITPDDLMHISTEKFTSHRVEGKQFIVHAYLAKVDKEKATAKNDPDQEISEWKWVDIHPDTEELKPESRHAQKDSVLAHLFLSKKPFANSLEYDVAAFEASGGDDQYDLWRKRLVDNPGLDVDKALLSKAEVASKQAFGEIKWQFVVFYYLKHGGTFK